MAAEKHGTAEKSGQKGRGATEGLGWLGRSVQCPQLKAIPTAQNIRGSLVGFPPGPMQLDMGYWLGMTRETSGFYGIGAFAIPKRMLLVRN